ncbi:hypothetical protein SLE2022_006970 [Rubroshorea leprosula]
MQSSVREGRPATQLILEELVKARALNNSRPFDTEQVKAMDFLSTQEGEGIGTALLMCMPKCKGGQMQESALFLPENLQTHSFCDDFNFCSNRICHATRQGILFLPP